MQKLSYNLEPANINFFISRNFMNDSLRTDVFVRYAPETIATACIYLSARKLKVPLPKNPSWFDVLGVEEDDIKDCCYRIVCLYDRKKPNHEELERKVDELRRKMEDNKKHRSAAASAVHTPSNSSPASRTGSPANGISSSHERDRDHRDKDVREIKISKRETREGYQMNATSFGGERRSGANNSRHSSNQNDSRKSYQNRFQSISASQGNGTIGNIVGAGVNDENTNDKINLDPERNHDSRRGVDRDHRNRENHMKTQDIKAGEFDNLNDLARKHKKQKRSRSRSGGDDPARRDRKKGKQKRRGGMESPEDLSPTKKNKRHNREKSRYDERGHHPDYYDRRVGKEQTDRIPNPAINNSRSDENRGGCYAASDNMYYGDDSRRDRGSGYSSTNDQRNSGSFKERDREYYRR